MAAETFAYDPSLSSSQAQDSWVEGTPGLTVVAVDEGEIVGTAKMGPNHPGPGSHVATASFMVAADARGRGVGTALCRFALAWAKEHGYAGMQFNAVAESNRPAVGLYRREGFTVIGTVPGAFAHPTMGYVGLHIMYCGFREWTPACLREACRRKERYAGRMAAALVPGDRGGTLRLRRC